MIRIGDQSSLVFAHIKKTYRETPTSCKIVEVYNPPTMDCLNFYRVQTMIGGSLGNVLVMEFNGKATRFYIEC